MANDSMPLSFLDHVKADRLVDLFGADKDRLAALTIEFPGFISIFRKRI